MLFFIYKFNQTCTLQFINQVTDITERWNWAFERFSFHSISKLNFWLDVQWIAKQWHGTISFKENYSLKEISEWRNKAGYIDKWRQSSFGSESTCQAKFSAQFSRFVFFKYLFPGTHVPATDEEMGHLQEHASDFTSQKHCILYTSDADIYHTWVGLADGKKVVFNLVAVLSRFELAHFVHVLCEVVRLENAAYISAVLATLLREQHHLPLLDLRFDKRIRTCSGWRITRHFQSEFAKKYNTIFPQAVLNE